MKDLSLHILDIVQNSIRARAGGVEVSLFALPDGILKLEVSDNGQGMNEKQVAKVTDPFFTTRTTRRVGLGVPLLKQKAEQAGGSLTIRSIEGKGTSICAVFLINHPDCPPLGDIPDCIWMIMASNPRLQLIFRLQHPGVNAEWNSGQIVSALDGINLTEPVARSGILDWFNGDFSTFKEYISRN